MEILRFEQVPESAPQRKKSSRGFLALGLVAALFGISTAFASSTITVNSDAPIQLGQGVTSVVACDNQIGVTPTTVLADDASTFFLNTVKVGTSGANLISANCAGKIFRLTFYDDANPPVKVSACSEAAIISGYQLNYVGGSGDFMAHKCYDKSVYIRVDEVVAAGTFTVTWGYNILTTPKLGWDLKTREFGRIVLETVDKEALPFKTSTDGDVAAFLS
jgi:hypothetical protein